MTTEKLLALIRGKHSSLSITYNDHAANYWDAKTAIQNGDLVDDDWVSPEERTKALADNSVWQIQWYPDTPVGCHVYLGSTLESVVNAAFKKDSR